MAGTCNDCGSPTWGRYRICPDCRKARKRKKSKICEICGNTIKGAGKKYCSYCKNSREAKINSFSEKINYHSINNYPYIKSENKKIDFKTILILIIVGLFLLIPLIIEKPNSEKNIPQNNSTQKIISPEEKLINFCTSQFSNEGIFNLKNLEYQNDFSYASDWIRDNYENSALTQEQKKHNINYIIENQLPKQGYPLVITSGNKKDGQVISQGFYYCNKNGVI